MENNHSDSNNNEVCSDISQPLRLDSLSNLASPAEDGRQYEIESDSGGNSQQPSSCSNNNSTSFRIPRNPISQIRIEPASPKPETSIAQRAQHISTPTLWNSFKFPWPWKVALKLWNSWKWSWKLEFIASFFILASPFLIVGTVYPHAGRPIPQWKFGITINALLSIYNVIFKACLTSVVASCVSQLQWTWFSTGHRPLYDIVRYNDAAQGSWGSIQLLWVQRIRQPLTALGALILILVVAIDPFIQQIVSTVDCDETLQNQTATLQRTNMMDYWSGVAPLFSGDSVRMGEVATYNPSDSMSWQCWTGNCTFSEPYATLGFCNSCEDLSDRISLTTTYRCFDQTNWTTADQTFSEDACSLLGPSYTWGVGEMSTGLYLGNYSDYSEKEWLNLTLELLGGGPIKPTEHDMAVGYPFTPNNQSHVFGVFILLGATPDGVGKLNLSDIESLTGCDTVETRDKWYCRGYGAAACTFSPCVRVYNATVHADQLEEQLLLQSDSVLGFAGNTTGNVTDYSGSIPESFSIIDTQCLSQDQKGGLEQMGLQIDGSSRWLPFNFTTLADGTVGQYNGNDTEADAYLSVEEWDPLIASLLIDRCLYLMYQPFAEEITTSLFKKSLDGVIQSAFIRNTTASTSGIANFSFWQFTGPSILLSMYNNSIMDLDGVQSIFANLSDIATAWTRAHGQYMYSTPANGTILHYATCIYVQWPWLAFPASLALLSLLLFVLVVLVTNREKTPIWKDLPLVWFMRDHEATGESTIESMEERSKHITITLLKGREAKIQIISAKGDGEGENI